MKLVLVRILLTFRFAGRKICRSSVGVAKRSDPWASGDDLQVVYSSEPVDELGAERARFENAEDAKLSEINSNFKLYEVKMKSFFWLANLIKNFNFSLEIHSHGNQQLNQMILTQQLSSLSDNRHQLSDLTSSQSKNRHASSLFRFRSKVAAFWLQSQAISSSPSRRPLSQASAAEWAGPEESARFSTTTLATIWCSLSCIVTLRLDAKATPKSRDSIRCIVLGEWKCCFFAWVPTTTTFKMLFEILLRYFNREKSIYLFETNFWNYF